MEKIIGIVMLVAFFIGIFVFIAIEDGIRVALGLFVATTFTVVFVAVAAYLIAGGAV